MSDINWKEDAVCYAMDMQWFDHENSQLLSQHSTLLPYNGIIDIKDFQLNEIREGDFIPVSELDTEQKYNDVVEVFGLFGFKRFDNASYADTIKAKTDSSCLKVNPSGELICNWHKGDRQLTYHQIIAIGKIKRVMLDKVEDQLIDHQTLESKDDIDFIAVKHESAVTAMERLGYKYCEIEKQWYKEVKEWV